MVSTNRICSLHNCHLDVAAVNRAQHKDRILEPHSLNYDIHHRRRGCGRQDFIQNAQDKQMTYQSLMAVHLKAHHLDAVVVCALTARAKGC